MRIAAKRDASALISAAGSMKSRTASPPVPSASLEPIELQPTIPFTVRSPCITGSCEKSCSIISVAASRSGASGEMETGARLAADSLPMR